MSNKASIQAKEEVRIFKKFAGVCSYSIDITSITKREPPEPDILCNLSDGSVLALELVECIDDSLAQSIYGPIRLNEALYSELDKFPSEKKRLFKAKYGDALMGISFNEGISARKKESSIPGIFDYLLSLGSSVEGEFELRSHRCLKDAVRSITVERGIVGPMFYVESATFSSDPCRERIREKFNKNYETKSAIELLAYYKLQLELPKERWLPSVQEFLRDNIQDSAFRRVWIYSVNKDMVIFAYPEIASAAFLEHASQ
ncbi:MAG: hypothetical protein PHE61_07595 [Candidatus Omnitrophica bacterium]|nr:hypothetical protein [Candidatus Omnitrophota bacterium]